MTALFTTAGAAVVTWLLRVLLITVVPAGHLPAAVQRVLPHVGPAVLAAVVAAALVGRGSGDASGFLVGAVTTGAVAWRSKNLVLSTAAGLVAVTLVSLL